MYEQQRISAVASSCNSSSMVSSKTYDVFLSFRGEDTRRNFTSHLYKALNEEKVKTYMDDQLEKGDEISQALTKAIEDSHVSIVIFSENYASSKWCLDEVSKILVCQKEKEQIVIPIFYNIDPSHVRKQTGSYEQAFAKHEGEPNCNKWKAALTEVANIAGWDSQNYRSEPEFLKDIVKDVLQKLAPRYPIQRKGLVGIEESYDQIESQLNIGSSEVKVLGIWGMGGIGKTTLATAVYDKLSYEFEGRCFLSNVREKSDRLESLRDELLSKLLGNKNHDFDNFDMSRLQRKKVFIVLDDVATSEQIEKLIMEYNFLGPGSRVIVTTRNKQVLNTIDAIYLVQDLSFHHSFQLFCLSAFGEKQPKDGYEYLSRRAVSYCKGIPLALKVLGAGLRSRSKKAWECELEKLKKIPNMEIHKVLKLSYDGLDRSQKDIFLDIACFFKGETRNYVTSVMEAFDDFFPASGIEVLLDKALIAISYANKIEMHDLIQEMGREIVHQECVKDPGRRSRLWRHEEVNDILKFNRGTDVVEGIILDLCILTRDLYLSSASLAKMTNMRFLKIHRMEWHNRFNVYLQNGLNSLFYKLRYLEWDRFCLGSLPSNFCAEQLVELRMPHSSLQKLWDGVQNLMNLKVIDLSYAVYLTEIPDLSEAQNLERVYLRNCYSLRQHHPSKLSLPKLTCLCLSGCREIESLNIDSKCLQKFELHGCSSLKEISVTSEEMVELNLSGCIVIESLNVHSKCLYELNLKGCSSLKEISVTSEEMTSLNLSGIVIRALSSSMLCLPKLTFLYLRDCREIESLNVDSKYLRELDLDGCSSLKEISMTSEEMTELNLSGCRVLESLNVHSKSLFELDLNCCSSLKEISVASEEMTELNLSGTAIRALSSSMLCLPKLTYLCLSGCKEIKSLNVNSKYLRKLNLNGCSYLKEISVTSEKMKELNLFGTAICVLPSSIGHLLSLVVLILSGSNVKSLPASIKNLSMLRKLFLNKCRKLLSLPDLPPSLKVLLLDDCRTLLSLPELPPSMEEVRALNCYSLETEITQRLVLQHFLQSRIPYLHKHAHDDYEVLQSSGYIMFPGDHVTDECGFCTTESSITIPYLPVSHLCGFIYCIILSGELSMSLFLRCWCSIYQDGIEISRKLNDTYNANLTSDHVSFWYHDVSKIDQISKVYDHLSNTTFKFEIELFPVEWIKGCGVFPVYASELGLKLVSSSSKDILEWESFTQIFDNPRAIGIGVGCSNNENDDDRQNLLPTSKRRRNSP